MIDYIRDMNKNYIRISCEDDDVLDSYCMKMVDRNNIEGVIRPRMVNLNGKTSLLYEISGMISLEERYADKLFSATDLFYISEFLKSTILNGKKYMLDLDGFVLDPKYIVCGVGNKEWHLIYNITERNSIQDSLKKLFEFILERLDHKDGQAVVIGYALYKRVCQDALQPEMIFEDIMELNEAETGSMVVEQVTVSKEYNTIIPETIQEEKEIKLDRLKAVLYIIGGISALVGLWAGFGGIVIGIINGKGIGLILIKAVIMIIFIGLGVLCILLALGRSEYFNVIVSRLSKINYSVDKVIINNTPMVTAGTKELVEEAVGNSTMLLSGVACTKLIMRGKGNHADREFVLEEMPVTIGSAKADIIIDEPGISRIHARISREGELLFIKDMNSTNGTWVNEHQLTVYELCRINNGDIIKLADTSFELIDTLF